MSREWATTGDSRRRYSEQWRERTKEEDQTEIGWTTKRTGARIHCRNCTIWRRIETDGDGESSGHWRPTSTTLMVHSFIHSGYLYSAPSRNLLRGALSPATVKEKCLKKLAERRHVVLR